ncbi:hypothetical protein K1719_035950 [Acacia pycnantha]|nr:hypothetical protein K1719_035950 [Acacia pycnantha]
MKSWKLANSDVRMVMALLRLYAVSHHGSNQTPRVTDYYPARWLSESDHLEMKAYRTLNECSSWRLDLYVSLKRVFSQFRQ